MRFAVTCTSVELARVALFPERGNRSLAARITPSDAAANVLTGQFFWAITVEKSFLVFPGASKLSSTCPRTNGRANFSKGFRAKSLLETCL
jgi:hypothetical protein